jgi:hypothetical protein
MEMTIEKCGLLGVHIMYALRDAIHIHCACLAETSSYSDFGEYFTAQ